MTDAEVQRLADAVVSNYRYGIPPQPRPARLKDKPLLKAGREEVALQLLKEKILTPELELFTLQAEVARIRQSVQPLLDRIAVLEQAGVEPSPQ